MKVFYLFFLLKQVSGTIYRQVEHARHENTIYEEDEPSKIACVHKCLRLQADAIYIDMVCRCTRMNMVELLPDEGPLATRQYFISVGRNSQHEITAESKWKRINIIEKETNITNNTLVTTIRKVTKEYVLNVDVKPTAFDSHNLRNVIHFTKGASKYGSRTPAIYFNHRKPGVLTISSAVKGPAVSGQVSKAYGYEMNTDDTLPYPLNQWIHIKISQIRSGSDYTFSVHVNTKLVTSVKNNQPDSFSDVKVYVSNPWASPQAGLVRNLWIDVLD